MQKKPLITTINRFNAIIVNLKEAAEKIEGVYQLIQDKNATPDNEEHELKIYPHEIAAIMGHHDLATLISNQIFYNALALTKVGLFDQSLASETTPASSIPLETSHTC